MQFQEGQTFGDLVLLDVWLSNKLFQQAATFSETHEKAWMYGLIHHNQWSSFHHGNCHPLPWQTGIFPTGIFPT